MRLWDGTSLQHSILGIVEADDEIQIDGDYVDRYPAGTVLVITNNANAGTYTVASISLTGGDTFIVTEEDLASDTGAAGEITIQNRFDFDWGQFLPKGNRPQISETDRLGLVHRLGPSDSTEKQSFAISGMLQIHHTEIFKQAMDSTAFPDMLRAKCALLDTELELFDYQYAYLEDETLWERKLAFTLKIEDIWAILGSLESIGGNLPEFFQFPLTITSDGVFTNIDLRTSTTYRTRPS